MKNIPLSLAVSVAAGTFTLLRPADWSPRVRRAYVVLPGVLTSAGTAFLFFGNTGRRSPEVPTSVGGGGAEDPMQNVRRLPPSIRVALSLGLGTVVSGCQAASMVIDSSIEDWLARRGLEHPRLWMAVFAALVCLASDLAGDSDEPSGVERHRPRS